MSAKSLLLLCGAGQDLSQLPKKHLEDAFPNCERESELNLKNICRGNIRQHLLKLLSHENLFVRVPRLPLPKALQSYLLYDQTLDDVAEETDDSSAEAGSA